MTLGKKLLDLTLEYQWSVENRTLWAGLGTPSGRTPEEIAAEYEATLKELHTPALAGGN